MKKIFLLVLLPFVIVLKAQEKIDINIKKSEIIKEQKKRTSLSFSDNDGSGGVVTVKTVYGSFGIIKGYKIAHFDTNLKLIKSIYLENTSTGSITDMFVKEGVVNLIRIDRNKKTKAIKVSVLSSSIEDLKFTSKDLYILNREKFKRYFVAVIGVIPITNGISQMDEDSGGMITFSKNKKFMVLSFDLKSKEEESHLFVVFDSGLNEIYTTTFKSNIKDKFFDFEDIDISDKDGTIFLLGKVFENESLKSKKKEKTNYHYELYKLTANNKEKITIKEPNNFIGSLYLLHQDTNLALVGFYGNKNDYRYKGVCRFDLKDNLSLKNKSFQPFSKQFFEDKYRKGTKVKKSKKELKDLDFKSVFLNKNGEIIINA